MRERALSREPWLSLVRLFRQANFVAQGDFLNRLTGLDLDPDLADALVQAVKGDNRSINTWLVTRPDDWDDPLAWIAPVMHEGERCYVWFVGFQTPEMSDLRRRCRSALWHTVNDPLLEQRHVPPFLLFVDLVESSRFVAKKYRQQTDWDEFAIFQTNYRAGETEVSDFEQQMILNTDYLVKVRQRVFRRASLIAPTGAENLRPSESDLRLFALAHTEGHNQGHYTGAWPWGDDKNTPLYEAIEEYRSCVAAIRLAQHWGFSRRQLDAFAVSIFLVRFLGHGLDAYWQTDRQRDAVREVMVGLLFFDRLQRSGAIRVTQAGGSMSMVVSPGDVRVSLLESLQAINDTERELQRKGDVDGLREMARDWYAAAFPDGGYPPEAAAVLDYFSPKKERVP